MRAIQNTKTMLIDSHIKDFFAFDRASGLGGSEASAVVGLHRYKTALDVYLEKHGLAGDFAETETMREGRRLEPVAAERYAEEKGILDDSSLDFIDPQITITHPKIPWAYGSPDRLIVDSEGRWLYGLEVKCVFSWQEARLWGPTESTRYPPRHAIQCLWYLAICRELCRLQGWPLMPHWDLCVLIHGLEFRHYRITHDQELEENLFFEAGEFWRETMNGNPPEPTDRDNKNLTRLWPQDDGTLIQGEERHRPLIEQYKLAKANYQTAKAQKEEAERSLKLVMGEAAGIEGPDYRITWRHTKQPRRVDYRGIVSSIKPSRDVIEMYTKLGAPQRTFRAKFNEAENE